MSAHDTSAGLLVTLDGTVADRQAPRLRADDFGVLRGDGIFEAFLVVDGRPELLEEHLTRLARSAEMVDLDLPERAAWRRAVAVATSAWTGGPEMVVRLVLTRGPEAGDGPTGFVLADPLNPTQRRQREEGVAVLALDRGLDPDLAGRAPWLLMGAKTLSYSVNMAAQRWARAHGADDVIFTAAGGVVLEGPTSAVVAARGRRLVSPPTSLGILASISLQALFERAPASGWEVAYEPLRVADLHAAGGVWLLSSVRLVSRVHTLDGSPLPDAGLTKEIAGILGLGPG